MNENENPTKIQQFKQQLESFLNSEEEYDDIKEL